MKSQIFKNAWTFFSKEQISFSDALKKSWKLFKEIKVVEQVAFNGKKVVSYVINFAQGSVRSIAKANVLDLLKEVANLQEVHNSGAAAYYADGTNFYNAD